MSSQDLPALKVTFQDLLEARERIKSLLSAGLEQITEACAVAQQLGIDLSCVDTGHTFMNNPTYWAFRQPNDCLAALVKYYEAEAWDYLFKCSGIAAYMGSDDLKQWRECVAQRQTATFDTETVASTFDKLLSERNEMRERAIVRLVGTLPRDYKSNSRYFLANKLVFTSFVDLWGRQLGHLNYDECSKLDDLVRIFRHFENREPLKYHECHYRVLQAKAGVYELEYFTVKLFKNGNAHVLFNDAGQSHVAQVNAVLGRLHPSAIPDKVRTRKRKK